MHTYSWLKRYPLFGKGGVCKPETTMKQFYIWITALLVCYGGSAYAQQATLTGKVVNEQSQPLDLATVHLLNVKESTTVRTVFPDKQGGFTLTGVAPGSYRVTAEIGRASGRERVCQ